MPLDLENDPQKIRLRMQRLRQRMDHDFQEMVENTQRMLDWKDYVRQFPYGMMAVGVLAGFFFAPGRKVIPSVRLAEETVKELSEQVGIGGSPREEPRIPSPWTSQLMGGAVSALSGIALSSLSMVLRHKLEKYLTAIPVERD